MINNVFFILIIAYVMNGCVSSTNNLINIENENFEKQKMPIRLYKILSTKDTDFYKSDWAGKKGRSITLNSMILYSDVLKAFNQKCGFEQSDLVEIRIVSHRIPIFYEVWIFKDKLSKREDKLSGLSVVLNQLPSGGGVDIYFHGECHSSEPFQFIIGK